MCLRYLFSTAYLSILSWSVLSCVKKVGGVTFSYSCCDSSWWCREKQFLDLFSIWHWRAGFMMQGSWTLFNPEGVRMPCSWTLCLECIVSMDPEASSSVIFWKKSHGCSFSSNSIIWMKVNIYQSSVRCNPLVIEAVAKCSET